MTPAPMSTSFSGTFLSESAPVEETMVSSSISMAPPGKGVTSDPVAMRMFLVGMASPLHVTVFASVMVPVPL